MPGRLRVTHTVERRQDAGPILVERGIDLIGSVRDTGEEPIAGAEIRAAGAVPGETNADGRFLVSVPDLPTELQVTADGYRALRQRIANVKELDLRLQPGEQIVGRLAGEPSDTISELEVRFRRTAGGTRHHATETVEVRHEAFRLDLPGPGTYSLHLNARGYEELWLPGVEVDSGQALDLGVLALSRGAGIRGLVVDAGDGQPSRGALVEAFPVGNLLIRTLRGYGLVSDVTDSTGAFTLAGMSPGRYHVRVHREGYATVHRLVDVEGAGLVDSGTIHMGAGVTLHGRLTDRDDTARPGVRVRLLDPATETLRPWAQTTTDAEGRYRFEAVAAGRYRVQVLDDRLSKAQEIEVHPGQAEQELDLEAGGTALRGWLTYRSVPVSGGSVMLTSALEREVPQMHVQWPVEGSRVDLGTPRSRVRAEVGEDGSFFVEDAPTGLVWFAHGGPDAGGSLIFRAVEIPHRSEFELRLELQGVPLEGRVVDAVTRAGLAARVDLFDLTGRQANVTQADEDGWFRFEDLEPGRYDIRASVPSYDVGWQREVEVGSGVGVQEIAVEASEPDRGAIEIALRRDDGTEATGVVVTALRGPNDRRGTLPSQTLGKARFEGLQEGDYYVTWFEPLAGAGATPPIRVSRDRTTPLELSLSPGASVTLTCPVSRCAGAPVDLLSVRSLEGVDLTSFLSGVSPAVYFSDDGELSLGRLAPGRYELRLWAGGERWEREITVGTGVARIGLR